MRNIKFIVLSTILFTSSVFTSCNKTSYDVMVVGVNTTGWEEIDEIYKALENQKQEKIDGLNFYTGKIGNKSVVVAETPVGMSEAAMTTTVGIKQYHPKYVISEGTSGGHHDQAKIYEIILGKDIYDVSSFKGPADEPSKWEGKYKGLNHPILHSDEKLLTIAEGVKYEHDIKPNGGISSSDCWNTSTEFVNKLHARLNDDCEEMESYGVINVCGYYKIPSLAIRIISNNVYIEEPTPEKFKIAADYVQQYTIDLIKTI